MTVPLFVPIQIETEKLLAHLVEEEMNKRTVKYCQFLPRPLPAIVILLELEYRNHIILHLSLASHTCLKIVFFYAAFIL